MAGLEYRVAILLNLSVLMFGLFGLVGRGKGNSCSRKLYRNENEIIDGHPLCHLLPSCPEIGTFFALKS